MLIRQRPRVHFIPHISDGYIGVVANYALTERPRIDIGILRSTPANPIIRPTGREAERLPIWHKHSDIDLPIEQYSSSLDS